MIDIFFSPIASDEIQSYLVTLLQKCTLRNTSILPSHSHTHSLFHSNKMRNEHIKYKKGTLHIKPVDLLALIHYVFRFVVSHTVHKYIQMSMKKCNE